MFLYNYLKNLMEEKLLVSEIIMYLISKLSTYSEMQSTREDY